MDSYRVESVEAIPREEREGVVEHVTKWDTMDVGVKLVTVCATIINSLFLCNYGC